MSAVDKVASRLLKLEKEVRRLATATRLTNSSIDNGALVVKDADGVVRQTIGTQPDGTVTTVDHNGGPPPQPTAPTVTPGFSALTVAWDGKFVDDAARPSDFTHIEVHVSETSGFTPTDETQVGTINGRSGLVVVGSLTADVTYYAVLVATNSSKAESVPSAEVSGVPEAAVGGEVLDGSITTLKLADDAVTAAKIAAGAVGSAEIAGQAVDLSKLADGSVDATKLVLGAVGSDQLASAVSTDISTAKSDAASAQSAASAAQSAATAAQTTADSKIVSYVQDDAPATANEGDLWIATGSGGNSIHRFTSGAWTLYQFGSVALGADSVNSAAIVADAVTSTELATGAVGIDQIANGAVTHAKIGTQEIFADNIALNTITANNIAADAIGVSELAAGAVVAGKVAAGAITSGTIAAGVVGTNELAANSVVAGKIAASAVTAGKLAAGSVQAGNIAAGAVQAGNVAANTITGSNIVGLSITGDKLAANTITAGQIAAGAITASSLAADAVTGKTVTGGIVRTAASGSRVELNATESTQDISFIAADESKATIGQSSFDSGATSVGQGIAARGVIDGASKQASFELAPGSVELNVKDVTTPASPAYVSSITASPDFALLQYAGGGEMFVQSGLAQIDVGGANYIKVSNFDGTYVSSGSTSTEASYIHIQQDGMIVIDHFSSSSTIQIEDSRVTLTGGNSQISASDAAGIHMVSAGGVEVSTELSGSGVWAWSGNEFRVQMPLTFSTNRIRRATSSSKLTLTGTSTAVPGTGMTITTTAPLSEVFVTGVFDFSADASAANGGNSVGRLEIDGTEQTEQAIWSPQTSGRACVSQTWNVQLTPGSHVLKLKATGSGTASHTFANSTHTTITAAIISGG